MSDEEMVKKSKYNYGEPIPLDAIPISDTEEALRDFANGSRGLEICLRVLWMHGLKTYASYPGNRNTFDIAYIVMEEEEDVFSYLSDEFLNHDNIRIDIVDNRQIIKFSGNDGEKNSEMIFLAQNIMKRKRYNNSLLVQEKIGLPFPDGWVRKIQFYDSNPNLLHWSSKVFIKQK